MVPVGGAGVVEASNVAVGVATAVGITVGVGRACVAGAAGILPAADASASGRPAKPQAVISTTKHAMPDLEMTFQQAGDPFNARLLGAAPARVVAK